MIRSVLIDLLSSKELRQSLKSLFSPCEIHDECETSSTESRADVLKLENTPNENGSEHHGKNLYLTVGPTPKQSEIMTQPFHSEYENQAKNNTDIGYSLVVTKESQDFKVDYLASTDTATPALSTTFSPFLIFSEDRSSFDKSKSQVGDHDGHHVILINDTTIEKVRRCCQESDMRMNILQVSQSGQMSHTMQLPAIADEDVSVQRGRMKSMNRKGLKKRKVPNASITSRLDRQPQKRFSLDTSKLREDIDDDLFGPRKDGRIRLTTNIPRQVEAVNPVTKERMQSFASCSEAARVMDINRTRMSRSKSFNDND
jgi:hypothetical protein